MSDIKGCGSHSCRIARPTGMGVNGPCTCWRRVVPLEQDNERLREALLEIMSLNYSELVEGEHYDIAKEALEDDNA